MKSIIGILLLCVTMSMAGQIMSTSVWYNTNVPATVEDLHIWLMEDTTDEQGNSDLFILPNGEFNTSHVYEGTNSADINGTNEFLYTENSVDPTSTFTVAGATYKGTNTEVVLIAGPLWEVRADMTNNRLLLKSFNSTGSSSAKTYGDNMGTLVLTMFTWVAAVDYDADTVGFWVNGDYAGGGAITYDPGTYNGNLYIGANTLGQNTLWGHMDCVHLHTELWDDTDVASFNSDPADPISK